MANGHVPRTRCFVVVLPIALVAGCGVPSTTSTHEVDARQNANRNSATELVDLDGHSFDLWQNESDSAATVIIFTRSDCPISNRYAPTVKKLHAAYEPRGVRFYLVYVDPKEEAEEIRQHLKEFSYPCPGLRDSSHALVKLTGVTVTPEAVVFDARRKIAYRGRIDDLYADYGQSRDEATTHELADAIEAVLFGKTVAQARTKAVGCPIADL
jgi:hypothetical protein